jgi:hypothetical protein
LRYIEQLLREYTENKLKLELIKFRIDAYKFALDNPDSRYNYFPVSSGLSSATKESKAFFSIVESNLISEEDMRYRIKEEIRKEESAALHLRFQTEQIDKALNILSREEYYIIDCKFFTKLKLSWADVERNYNDKFKSQIGYKYGTERTLRRMYNKSLIKLEAVLGINSKIEKSS